MQSQVLQKGAVHQAVALQRGLPAARRACAVDGSRPAGRQGGEAQPRPPPRPRSQARCVPSGLMASTVLKARRPNAEGAHSNAIARAVWT